MTLFEQPIVQTPLEEFRQFTATRLEGLEITEEEASLEVYRRAVEMGLNILKAEKSVAREVAPCN